MEKKISFEQYRSIDLTILMVVLAVCQTVIYYASSYWFPNELYIASPMAAVVTLVMMRWGVYAGIHALLGGVLHALLFGGSWQHVLIFGGGNLLAMAALLYFKFLGKERIRKDAFLSLLLGLSVQLLMQLGRAGLAMLAGYPAAACLGFITTDALSVLLTLVAIWIVRRIEGLFEDQKTYLLRIQSEQ